MNYFENGEWKPSEDLLELFPEGIVARRGPYKTIFSSDLNVDTVDTLFDIQTPEGDRIRGGVRAIQLTDMQTGRSLVLGTLKESTPAEFVPPNQVIYRSGFNGIEADVLLVWTHNNISQNVILLEQPVLPPGFDPATTRIEIVTEFIETPEPNLMHSSIERRPRKPDARDDAVFGLGSLIATRGKAFSLDNSPGFAFAGDHALTSSGIEVKKELLQDENGRRFLIESPEWDESARIGTAPAGKTCCAQFSDQGHSGPDLARHASNREE